MCPISTFLNTCTLKEHVPLVTVTCAIGRIVDEMLVWCTHETNWKGILLYSMSTTVLLCTVAWNVPAIDTCTVSSWQVRLILCLTQIARNSVSASCTVIDDWFTENALPVFQKISILAFETLPLSTTPYTVGQLNLTFHATSIVSIDEIKVIDHSQTPCRSETGLTPLHWSLTQLAYGFTWWRIIQQVVFRFAQRAYSLTWAPGTVAKPLWAWITFVVFYLVTVINAGVAFKARVWAVQAVVQSIYAGWAWIRCGKIM